MIRFVLAATLCANYGIYGPAFELLEHVPREPGSEEYRDSEKYEIRTWDLMRADSLRLFIARINRIRNEHPALQNDWSLQFHNIDNGQMLCYTELLTRFRSLGRDFFIIDFEGEPSRPLSERRIKRSALRDLAGMLRSLHYAPHAVLFGQAQVVVRPEDAPAMEIAGRYWHRWVSGIFLKSYLHTAAGQDFLPQSENEIQVLLPSFLLEKACYEIAYELNNRPKWVGIPIRGVLQLLDEPEK